MSAASKALSAESSAAIGATFAVHLLFSYRRHLETGWMMDAYPRYYLPLIAALTVAPVIFRLLGGPLG